MVQRGQLATGSTQRTLVAAVLALVAASPAVLSVGAWSAGSVLGDSSQVSQSLNCAKQPCQITLKKLATLSPKGYSLQIPVPYVAQDNKGRFFAATSDRSKIAVFDASGRFLDTVGVTPTAARSTMVLLPTQTGLLAWVSPEQTFAIKDLVASQSSARFPYRPSFVRSDGAVVVAQQIQEPSLLGYPLHIVSPDGRITKSFGADPPEYRADLRLFMERVAAPAADGAIWASALGRYVIEKWDPATGARLSRVQVHSSWFVESPRYPAGPKDRPHPIVEALWEREGLLWILIRDADANWKPSPEPERRLTPSTMNEIYDWVIEVVDPSSGAVLASMRSGSDISGRPPQTFVIWYSTSPPDGLDLWTPVLTRKEKTP